MATSILTAPPAQARAGDTWSWRVSLPDYPAPTWVLSYILYSPTAKLTLTATADGSAHLITVLPATSEDFVAGRYDWIASVASLDERYQVDAGAMDILPDLAAISTGGHDGRSPARIILDAIDASLAGRASGDQVDLIRTQLGDRVIQRDPAVLLKWRQHYAAIVAAEDRALGKGANPGFVQQRFL